jgi:LuxR family maltose regulon positive regulatory protein
MSETVLQTKLFIPPPRQNVVSRQRLADRLSQGIQRGCRLTLVSAPAGFGKSTLVSEWVGSHDQPVAWISLDKGDNDPSRFWSYFIAALQMIQAGIGETALAALESPQSPPMEAVLTALLNEITAVTTHFAIVFDDYHVIVDSSIHEQLSFILEHQPPQMHLVIASRSDPPLNLSRLRGKGQLSELRTDELRFTPKETVAFLNDMMGLGLSARDVAALEARTEGWAVGLQMAALSLHGRDAEHVADFVASFTGSHRYVLDYLSDEVLLQQSPSVQTFLLQTSILDRLTGLLCDVVTNQDGGQETLERLDEGNLFIVQLDDERHWYRYHHLFADLLRNRLDRTQPDLLPILHIRASAWYESKGLLPEAISHAFASGDVDRVATMLEGNALSLIGYKHLKTSLGWFNGLPAEVIGARPWLIIAYAWTLAYTGFFEESLACLEQLKSEESATEMPDVSRHITGHINALRFFLTSFMPYAVEGAEAYGHKALALLPEDDLRTRSLIAVLLGRQQRMNHDYSSARETLSEAIILALTAQQEYAVVELLTQLARVETQQGTLQQAAVTCQEALALAGKQRGYGGYRPPIISFTHASLAHIFREWNRLDDAQHHAEEAIILSRQWEHIDSVVDGYIALLWIQLARKDGRKAMDTIQKIKRLDRNIRERYAFYLEGWETRVRLALGDVDHASQWAKERELKFFDGIVGSSSMTNLILARIRIAEFNRGLIRSLDDTIAHLASLAKQFEIVDSVKGFVDVMVLQAVALRAIGESDRALFVLTSALSLAKPEKYVRSFIDEGEPMAELLRLAVARDTTVEYSGKLLSEWAKEPKSKESIKELTSSDHLLEPLSERELEVLRLLAIGMSNQEIADQLFLAIGTIKKYTSNIYGKLSVHNRTQAVARARELDLV